MKYFIFILFLFVNISVYADILYYRNINTSEENSALMQVEFPEECLEIIEIYDDSSLEFKNNDGIEKIISECNTFIKGKKVQDAIKSSSDKVLSTGVKVKEGIQKGIKSGTNSITNSVSKETNLFIEDTIKLKDGIVSGTSNIINNTVETGSKITTGVSSFFKGVFSSEN